MTVTTNTNINNNESHFYLLGNFRIRKTEVHGEIKGLFEKLEEINKSRSIFSEKQRITKKISVIFKHVKVIPLYIFIEIPSSNFKPIIKILYNSYSYILRESFFLLEKEKKTKNNKNTFSSLCINWICLLEILFLIGVFHKKLPIFFKTQTIKLVKLSKPHFLLELSRFLKSQLNPWNKILFSKFNVALIVYLAFVANAKNNSSSISKLFRQKIIIKQCLKENSFKPLKKAMPKRKWGYYFYFSWTFASILLQSFCSPGIAHAAPQTDASQQQIICLPKVNEYSSGIENSSLREWESGPIGEGVLSSVTSPFRGQKKLENRTRGTQKLGSRVSVVVPGAYVKPGLVFRARQSSLISDLLPETLRSSISNSGSGDANLANQEIVKKDLKQKHQTVQNIYKSANTSKMNVKEFVNNAKANTLSLSDLSSALVLDKKNTYTMFGARIPYSVTSFFKEAYKTLSKSPKMSGNLDQTCLKKQELEFSHPLTMAFLEPYFLSSDRKDSSAILTIGMQAQLHDLMDSRSYLFLNKENLMEHGSMSMALTNFIYNRFSYVPRHMLESLIQFRDDFAIPNNTEKPLLKKSAVYLAFLTNVIDRLNNEEVNFVDAGFYIGDDFTTSHLKNSCQELNLNSDCLNKLKNALLNNLDEKNNEVFLSYFEEYKNSNLLEQFVVHVENELTLVPLIEKKYLESQSNGWNLDSSMDFFFRRLINSTYNTERVSDKVHNILTAHTDVYNESSQTTENYTKPSKDLFKFFINSLENLRNAKALLVEISQLSLVKDFETTPLGIQTVKTDLLKSLSDLDKPNTLNTPALARGITKWNQFITNLSNETTSAYQNIIDVLTNASIANGENSTFDFDLNLNQITQLKEEIGVLTDAYGSLIIKKKELTSFLNKVKKGKQNTEFYCQQMSEKSEVIFNLAEELDLFSLYKAPKFFS